MGDCFGGERVAGTACDGQLSGMRRGKERRGGEGRRGEERRREERRVEGRRGTEKGLTSEEQDSTGFGTLDTAHLLGGIERLVGETDIYIVGVLSALLALELLRDVSCCCGC